YLDANLTHFPAQFVIYECRSPVGKHVPFADCVCRLCYGLECRLVVLADLSRDLLTLFTHTLVCGLARLALSSPHVHAGGRGCTTPHPALIKGRVDPKLRIRSILLLD